MDPSPLLSFKPKTMSHKWKYVPGNGYTTSYFLFILKKSNLEYKLVSHHFYCSPMPITCIQRIQHPYQFSQYSFKRNVYPNNYEDIIFHRVHREDLDIALKFNCDYKRYQNNHQELYTNGVYPKFYKSYKTLLMASILHGVYPLSDLVILVVITFARDPKFENDHFIQYIVKF